MCRTPCRSGLCSSPLEITVGQLRAAQILPVPAAKVLLYPGGIMKHWVTGVNLTWDSVLEDFNMTSFGPKSAEVDYRVEVMIGSYFVVGGGIAALFKASRMAVFGLICIAWGLFKEGLFEPPEGVEPHARVKLMPAFFVALLLAILALNTSGEKIGFSTQAPAKQPDGIKGTTEGQSSGVKEPSTRRRGRRA
eukprot:jgi/Mesen1/10489/ME000083S09989